MYIVQIPQTLITSQVEQKKYLIWSDYSITLSESINNDQSLTLLLHYCKTQICELRLCGQTKLALYLQLQDRLCSHITYNQAVIWCSYLLLYLIIHVLCAKAVFTPAEEHLSNLQDWLWLSFMCRLLVKLQRKHYAGILKNLRGFVAETWIIISVVRGKCTWLAVVFQLKLTQCNDFKHKMKQWLT